MIAVAIMAMVLIGMLGLCTDLGRLYIAKNELQAYADSASTAANHELDGTDAGIQRARQVASTYPNTWNLATQRVTGPLVTFAKEPDGAYTSTPPSPPRDYKYVRVDASGDLPLYFMSVFWTAPGQAAPPTALLLNFQLRTAKLDVDSLAAQFKMTTFGDNLLPYSPDAHLDPGRAPVTNPGFTRPDPFNFKIGQQYTMRWPPPGQRDKPNNWCGGDKEANFVTPDGSSDRGFIDIGNAAGSGGSSYIREAIVNNVQSHPLQIGDRVVEVSGNKGTESDSLRERINQDTDTVSRSWNAYKSNLANGNRVGNGRRVVFMPVNNPYQSSVVVDFAAFFLPVVSDMCGSSNVDTCCAEYIGPGLLFGRTAASDTIGVYRTKLLK